jgi:hypothetical protein
LNIEKAGYILNTQRFLDKMKTKKELTEEEKRGKEV